MRYHGKRRSNRHDQSHSDAEAKDRDEELKVLWQDVTPDHLKQLLADGGTKLSADDADRLKSLVELAGLQRKQIEYLTKQFRAPVERVRRHFPNEWSSLSTAADLRDFQELAAALFAEKGPKTTAKRVYEQKRSAYGLPHGGLIKWEFGGAAQAAFNKSSFTKGIDYQPTCLDDIFRGEPVNMLRLQDLFGMKRDRFPKQLPRINRGRETMYDYRGVTSIMRSLLNEIPMRNKNQGRPKHVWLGDPNVRMQVLRGIRTRLERLNNVPKNVGNKFLSLI